MAPLLDYHKIQKKHFNAQTPSTFVYPNCLKNREFGKEVPQIFRPARAAVLIDTARARDEKSGAKPTTPKIDSSGSLGINLLEKNGN
jgi:hypothetical protein